MIARFVNNVLKRIWMEAFVALYGTTPEFAGQIEEHHDNLKSG
jgi:hypothetical protein